MKTYITNLTSIRFVLALLVVIFHTNRFLSNQNILEYCDLSFLKKGSEAVYFFFSLSGFLIIRNLYAEKLNTKSINILSFLRNRVLRIFPLYYSVLLFGIFYYYLFLPLIGFKFDSTCSINKTILLGVTFFSNILNKYEPGGIIEILWSIGVEEQFYLIIAPVMFIIPRQRFLAFFVGFTVIYFLLFHSDLFPFLKNNLLYFYYFSFSGIIAIIYKDKTILKLIHYLKFPVLFLLIIYFFSSVFKHNFTTFYYHLFSMILFGLTIMILCNIKVSVFDNKFIHYGGKISYGIYMYHLIVLQFIGLLNLYLFPKYLITSYLFVIFNYILTIAITLFISHLSYQYFELRFLKLKK